MRMPSPFVELEVGTRRRPRDEPRQGAVSGRGPHEARPRGLLPRRRRRHRPRAARASDAAPPLPGRDRGRADLPEARSREAARVDRGGARHVPLGPARRRALRDRGRAGRLGGEPRGDRLPPLAVAAPGRRAPGRAADRRRPAAGDDLRRRRSASPRSSARCSTSSATSAGPRPPGNRGIHVAVRIEPRWEFPVVRRCALAFAREVERRAPELVTTAWWKEERGEKVFIDYNQNARDRTIASRVLGAAACRTRPSRRRSPGTSWPTPRPEDFTLATMPARFAAAGDVQAAIDDTVCDLERAARMGRARGAGRGRRGAVSAELPEDARRAEARAALARERST